MTPEDEAAILKLATAEYEKTMRERPNCPPDWAWYHAQTGAKARVLWDKLNGWTLEYEGTLDYERNDIPPDTIHGPVRLVESQLSRSSSERRRGIRDTDIEELPKQDALWKITGQYWDGEGWQHVDSMGDCIEWDNFADPFKNPYAADIMLATIAAYYADSKCRVQNGICPNAAEAQ